MNSIRLKHRLIGGAGPGSPTGTATSGEVAINFDVVAGAPELWAYDTGWKQLNPPVTVTTQSILLAGGTDIGNAYTTAATPLTGNVVIASYTPTGGTGQAYVLTTRAAPGTASSWTSLGGAVTFADATEIHAGSDTTKALNSAILRGETVLTSTGAPQADKLVRLGATGKLDPTLLPAMPSTVKGAQDLTKGLTGGPYNSGDIVFSNATGNFNGSWPGTGTGPVSSGDALIFDGANWHHVPNSTDLNAYLALAGGTMADGAKQTFNVTTGGKGTVVLDLATGGIDNAVIDCGVF